MSNILNVIGIVVGLLQMLVGQRFKAIGRHRKLRRRLCAKKHRQLQVANIATQKISAELNGVDVFGSPPNHEDYVPHGGEPQ